MATTPRPSFFRWGGPRHFVAAAALLSLILLVSCSEGGGPLGPSEESGDWIVFVSDRAGEVSETGRELVDIYRMNADGTDVLNLTAHPADTYSDLQLSPDHSTLLFRSTRSGCYEIWSMPPDSVEPSRLTGPGERCNTRPRWSPDGSMIAFTSSRAQVWEAYVMEADGSVPRNVSIDGGDEQSISDQVHGWTPDGRVVIHRPGPEHNTFAVNPDGTGFGPLFEDHQGYYRPHWSPDGSQVAFSRDVEGIPQLHLKNSDGSGVTTVSGEASSFFLGRGLPDPWSPDGEQIVLSGGNGEALDLYVMDADGSNLVQLTTGAWSNRFDGWSPDGSRIAFSSDRNGNWDVYVINRDGTGLERLTDSSTNDRNAVWVPRQN